MKALNHCKGCAGNITVSDEPVIYYSDPELDLPEVVKDELYQRRLEICKRCPSLQYGTTCMYSGAIVSHRAKLIEKSCPYPGSPKW
ncbi:DUF6171 family protein [Halalkalibacter kiskunsagensis]|uniref:DUF6171 family protein n=1 Tax=Halalkalibacter kiskunsagensis TaxID=1548599 RepID=A0ABV6KKT7_9BACI